MLTRRANGNSYVVVRLPAWAVVVFGSVTLDTAVTAARSLVKVIGRPSG